MNNQLGNQGTHLLLACHKHKQNPSLWHSQSTNESMCMRLPDVGLIKKYSR